VFALISKTEAKAKELNLNDGKLKEYVENIYVR
jgi:hypothetical protein